MCTEYNVLKVINTHTHTHTLVAKGHTQIRDNS